MTGTTWDRQIDIAMKKAGSPFTANDVIAWLRFGQASMAVAPCMHASVWFNPQGQAEIGHLHAKRWCNTCARWMLDRLKAESEARGCNHVAVTGRPGWARFLRMKGF
jgi:hypothetical protein